MAHSLVKTEPTSYSFADLERDRKTTWDRVSSPAVLRQLAAMREGDTVVVYHTGDEKQAVGLAHAVSGPYADPKRKNPKRLVVDLAADRRLPRPVTLTQVKADAVLETSDLARLPRLSVMRLREAQFERLLRLARE
jgi:predicted RNA-binding protein with PUA-like domain